MSKSFKYANTVNRALSKSLYYQDITDYFSEYLVDLQTTNIYNKNQIYTKNILTQNLITYGDTQILDLNVYGKQIESAAIIDEPTDTNRIVINSIDYDTNTIITKHSHGTDIKLPTVTDSNGMKYIIKNVSTNVTNIYPYTGENIDNLTSVSLNQWESISIYCDGTGWVITNKI